MKTTMLAATIACAATAMMMCSCSKPAEQAAAPEKAAPEKAVFELIVGFDAELPPYGYKDGDEYKGFDLDLAREVCKRRGWKFVPKPINWDAKDMELNSGTISCIWNGFTINGREDMYSWTEPYCDNSQVVLVKIGSPVTNLAALAGKTVAVQTDTPIQKALSAGGDKEALGKTFKQLVVTPNYNNAVMELDSGAVDAIAMDIGVAKLKISEAPEKFAMLDEIVMSEQYGIGFKKGNDTLRDDVQATLKEMAADGTAAKISAVYFEGKNVFIMK